MTEIMVVLKLQLLALKLAQSGAHHKKGGLTGSQFLEGVCWEREGDLFHQELQCLHKK